MERFNKFFAAVVAAVVAGLSGDDAFIAALLPAEVLPIAVGAIPVLVALIPNGRPFWEITRASVGATPPSDPTMRVQAHPLTALGALLLVLLLAGCQTAGQVTAIADSQVYPALRISSCALSPALVDARRAERYQASGIDAIADCSWYPGKTFDQYLAERAAAEQELN